MTKAFRKSLIVSACLAGLLASGGCRSRSDRHIASAIENAPIVQARHTLILSSSAEPLLSFFDNLPPDPDITPRKLIEAKRSRVARGEACAVPRPSRFSSA